MEQEKLTMAELSSELNHFTGTESYHKASVFGQVVVTDGVLHLAERAGAFWLIDALAAYLVDPERMADEGLTVFNISAKDDNAHIIASDGNGGEGTLVFTGYSDFPEGEARVWAQYNGEFWVMMLPSEY